MASKNVTIRLDETTLRAMQKVAEMYGKSLNGVLRDAVDDYLQDVPSKPDFAERLIEIRRRDEEVFDRLAAAVPSRN